MAASPHRVYVRQPLRSMADSRIGRLWTAQDLRSYRLGRAKFERLQAVVDNDMWRVLRVEQDQRDETTALELAERAWAERLRMELAMIRRAAQPTPDREPLPEAERVPRDVPQPPTERPPVSRDLPGTNLQPLDPPALPGVVVIEYENRNEPLDEAAIQAWAEFYAAFPPQV